MLQSLGYAVAVKKKLDAKPIGEPVKTEAELIAESVAKATSHRTHLEKSKTIRALTEKVKMLENEKELLLSLEDRQDPGMIQVQARKKNRRKTQAVFCALASDWHVEERVRPEAVDGVNEYNPEIAQERAERYTKSCLTILDLNRNAWDIDTMCQWLGGDFITGHLHLEAVQENYLSPSAAMILAFDILRKHLTTLLTTDLSRIVIPCNYGNHGRLTQKPQASTGHVNNLEWLLYCMLAKWYADEPRIEFQIANSYEHQTDFFGFITNWHHGDAVRYRGGLGGLTVPFYGRKARQSQGGHIVDLDCIGHHHVLQHPLKLIGNGSLIGYNAYAAMGGFAYQRAVQASFCVDEEHRTAYWPIEVE